MKRGLIAVILGAFLAIVAARADLPPPVLSGADAYGDWSTDAPDVVRRLAPTDMPAPYASKSVANPPHLVARPEGAWPKVPEGFKVTAAFTGLNAPRLLRRAPNGDMFLALTEAGEVRVLRPGGDPVFAKGLNRPFGIAFYPPGPEPQWVYIGTTDAVLRFPYHNGDAVAAGPAQAVVPTLPEGGHWTRDVVFTGDGKKMLVSVGSASNAMEHDGIDETGRADILEFDPEGKGLRVFAGGLRNPVGLAFHPETNDLWTVVNERDGLGDNLPPDYATRVVEGGFYGWPWYYIGAHHDPRHGGAHPELARSVLLPDVLIQPHSAPIQLAVYTGSQFPTVYRNDIFVALHGSWNRARRTGYKLVRLHLDHGKPVGGYADFMTGFVTPEGEVWGRPTGVGVEADGSLLVSDDASGTVWRITYI